MSNNNLLMSHYNEKYKFDSSGEDKPKKIIPGRYPRDRYEAAVFWGKGSGKALEIGAGSGKILNSLNEQYAEYVATELSEERIRFLNKFFGKDSRNKIIKNDIQERNLDFPPGYFDTIIMIAVIEHLVEPISVIKYCHSLLRHGGKLLIQTPNIAKWTRRLKLLLGFFPSTASLGEGLVTYENKATDLYDEGHLHYFTFRALNKILRERAGFRDIQACGHGWSFLSRFFPELFSECFVIGIK